MKIINREEFLKLPENILFCKYEPCVFSTPQIKQENAGSRDYYASEIIDIDSDDTGEFLDKCTLMEKGEKFPIELYTSCRDGLFDDDQLFLIYEKSDVKLLIKKLKECL